MEKSQWNKQISRLFPSTDETNLLFRWLSVCVFCLTSVFVVCSIFPEKKIFPFPLPNPCNENCIAIIGPLRKQLRQMSRQETLQNHRMEVSNLCGMSRGQLMRASNPLAVSGVSRGLRASGRTATSMSVRLRTHRPLLLLVTVECRQHTVQKNNDYQE